MKRSRLRAILFGVLAGLFAIPAFISLVGAVQLVQHGRAPNGGMQPAGIQAVAGGMPRSFPLVATLLLSIVVILTLFWRVRTTRRP